MDDSVLLGHLWDTEMDTGSPRKFSFCPLCVFLPAGRVLRAVAGRCRGHHIARSILLHSAGAVCLASDVIGTGGQIMLAITLSDSCPAKKGCERLSIKCHHKWRNCGRKAVAEPWRHEQGKLSGPPGSQPCAFTFSHAFWAGLFLTVNKAHKITLITFFVSD